MSFEFKRAVTRVPGADYVDALSTTGMGTPDLDKALEQHAAYCDILRSLGVEVTVLPAAPGLPDCTFVEDTAVIAGDAAIITIPGADSRKDEPLTIAPVLAESMDTHFLAAPGTLDGGDVLLMDKRFLVGVSSRSNADGVMQFTRLVEQLGFTCTPVPFSDGLHFKTFVNGLDDCTVLLTQEFSARPELSEYQRLVVPAGEEYAANSLAVNGTIIVPAGFPKTCDLLVKNGFTIVETDLSEYQKMDGGLTCLSLRW